MMAFDNFRVYDNEDTKGLAHSARVTCDQVGALATWLNYDKVVAETQEFCQRHKRKQLKQPDIDLVRKWLTNAWSTEYFLASISKDLGVDAITYAVHWAYPQAYYAVFALRMALGVTLGNMEDTHQKVIRRFGDDARNRRLPVSFSVCIEGIKSEWEHHNILKVPFDTDTRLRRSDEHSVIGYLGSSLRGTREYDLRRLREERKKDFKTQRGMPRKSLSKDNWIQIAEKLGPTSIVSYLYRKRIKANYDDVDAFHSDIVEAPQLLDDIRSVVRSFAFVHEALICSRIGGQAFGDILFRVPSRIEKLPESRWQHVYSCV